MQNVNKELQEFFREEDFGFTDDILNFLEENKDWDKKKIKAAALLNEIANRMNKISIYYELIQNNLRIYEEAVTKTLPTHRDHFVHSAYVYLLGLYISQKDKNYKKCLEEAFRYNHPVGEKDNNFERLFELRWAITALFHDAGYPVEIAAKQMNKYLIDVKWNKNDDKNPMRFEMRHFRDTYSFEYLTPPNPLFPSGEDVPRQAAQYIMTDNVFDMIAYNLAYKYIDFSYKTIRNVIIDCFQDNMKSGFIDHGIIGAIVLANLAHDLYSKNKWDPENFYCHFGDCLGAIVLHTRKNWMPVSFIKKISMSKHPIAWLLILCDEIQEWLRPSGEELEADGNIMEELDNFQIGFSDGTIDLHYRDYEDTKRLIDKLQWNLEPFNTKVLVHKL
jgi:hypothetical protein